MQANCKFQKAEQKSIGAKDAMPLLGVTKKKISTCTAVQSVADDKVTEYPCPKLRILGNILILRAVLGWVVPNLLILSIRISKL